MKLVRWISFAPAFIAYVTLINGLLQFSIKWLLDKAFPINTFIEYIYAGLAIMLSFGGYIWFIAFLYYVLKICPKVYIGSRILLLIYSIPVIYFWVTKFDNGSKINLIFDVTIIAVLAICSIKSSSDQ